MTYTATYSPDDNKLRLYALSRLDSETYAKVKAAGFRWAPKQDLFFAFWSTAAEDVALELAGEIEDEDKSLVERAEERAERFETYSDKRLTEAESARKAVAAIADNIPMGQPILVGHHSERHARRDAEKIENGMRRAVKLWKTSRYWTDRAEGALRHAKYLELPAVRARRIKKIESDLRRVRKNAAALAVSLELWSTEGLTQERALMIAGRGFNLYGLVKVDGQSFDAYDVLRPDGERWSKCPSMTVAEVQAAAKERLPKSIAVCQRWMDHYEGRLSYEKAMLAEQGASELLAPKPRPKQLPLCNYRAPGGITCANPWQRGENITYHQVEMTAAEYAAIYHDYKATRVCGNSHRVRTAYVSTDGKPRQLVSVFITDSKTHEPPPAQAPAPRKDNKPHPMHPYVPPEKDPTDEGFEQLEQSLRGGVKVAVAPELFVTPAFLAERIVDEAAIAPGMRVLEPSAGTGALLKAVGDGTELHAIEVNRDLARGLGVAFTDARVHCADFLCCLPNGYVSEFGRDPAPLGTFDRIVMNPPFANGADVEHVNHALKFLKPGGRLVAVMSAGVTFRSDRKTAAFRAQVERLGGLIEELPDGTFQSAGTGVRTVLVTIDNDEAFEEAA